MYNEVKFILVPPNTSEVSKLSYLCILLENHNEIVLVKVSFGREKMLRSDLAVDKISFCRLQKGQWTDE